MTSFDVVGTPPEPGLSNAPGAKRPQFRFYSEVVRIIFGGAAEHVGKSRGRLDVFAASAEVVVVEPFADSSALLSTARELLRGVVDAHSPLRSVVILVSGLDDITATIFSEVFSEVDLQANLIVLADDGQQRGVETENWPEKRRSYELLRSHYRQPDALTSLKAKLIKRLGRFETPASPRRARFHYDASLATNEVTQLLDDHVAALNSPIDVILYDSPLSSWLIPPVRALAARLGVPAFTPDEWVAECGAGRAVLVVVPMVASGSSLTELVRTAESSAPTTIRQLAILSTEGSREETGRRLIQRTFGAPFEVSYFLQVHFEDESEDDLLSSLPPTPRAVTVDSPHEGLSPTVFWDLVRTGGVVPEKSVPYVRRQGILVPDMSSLLTEYGTWLSLELQLRVERIVPRHQLVYVCPDHEPVSELLTRYLSDVLGAADVVRVPREAIEMASRVAPTTALLEQLRLEYRTSPWFQALSGQSSAARVVPVDDMIVDGGSMRGLTRIISAVGGQVPCWACLLDCGTDHPARQIVSLYRLPQLSSEGR